MSKAELMEQVEDNKKLVILKDVNPIAMLVSEDLGKTLSAIKTEVSSEIHDVGTDDGRKNIKSLGSKIGKSLRFVEKAALDHARELKAAPKIFDGQRKIFKDFMVDLQVTTLAPLIEYEEKLRAKAEIISNKLNMLMISSPNGELKEGTDTLEGAIAWKKMAESTVIDDSFGESQQAAERFRDQSLLIVDGLIAKYEKVVQEEAQAETERLELAAKERKDYEERIAKEATERAVKQANEAIEAEKRKSAQAKIDAENEAKQREAQAIIDKENAVKAESARVQKLADDKADKERRDNEAELARIKKVADERKAQEDVRWESKVKTSSQQKHQDKVHDLIINALDERGYDRVVIVGIIAHVGSGKIPYMKIDYLNK